MPKYGLFCNTDVDTYADTAWINSMDAAGFNVFLPRWAQWDDHGGYLLRTPSQINSFIDNVSAIIPDAEFYCWIGSGNGQVYIDNADARASLVACLNTLSTVAAWNGILDDLEIGDCIPNDNVGYLLDYLSTCAVTMQANHPTLLYYPWLYYSWVDDIQDHIKFAAVGMYNNHTYDEDPYPHIEGTSWKGALETIDASTVTAYLLTVISEDWTGQTLYPTVDIQLQYFNEVGGFASYPRCSIFTFYWDFSIYQDVRDYTAWYNWYNSLSPSSIADGFWEPAKRNSDPSTVGWGVNQSGRLWFNSSSGKLKYWNGSLIKTVVS